MKHAYLQQQGLQEIGYTLVGIGFQIVHYDMPQSYYQAVAGLEPYLNYIIQIKVPSCLQLNFYQKEEQAVSKYQLNH